MLQYGTRSEAFAQCSQVLAAGAARIISLSAPAIAIRSRRPVPRILAVIPQGVGRSRCSISSFHLGPGAIITGSSLAAQGAFVTGPFPDILRSNEKTLFEHFIDTGEPAHSI
jgi:hypothetical protein